MAAGALLACVIVTAGCGSPGARRTAAGSITSAATSPSSTDIPLAPTVPVADQTPEQAALTWFAAIDRKDRAQSTAAIEPADAELMVWGDGDPSEWPVFTDVECQPFRASTTTATVYCTFSESLTSNTGNPDTFWMVTFDRRPAGRWLITSYGQD